VEPFFIDQQGLVLDGHLSTDEAIARAHDWDRPAFYPGSVRHAWWGGERLGFVGREHPDAREVTVVNALGPGDDGDRTRALLSGF